jgi:CubicO group peptidase (beta-lactamase class C family)
MKFGSPRRFYVGMALAALPIIAVGLAPGFYLRPGTVAPPPALRPPTSPTTFQSIIDEAVAAGVPGIQAWVKDGQVRWNGVAGLSSVEQQQPMAVTDRIRVASITKMMTYATVMELVKAGRLGLEDHVAELLPAGALLGIPNASEITISQLLDHRSGVHNFNGEDGADFFADLFVDPQRGERQWSASDLLVYARKPTHEPTGRPGERTSYSSTGYLLLQMLLEHIEGEPFPALYQRYLFTPLGMASAGVEGAKLMADSIAPSYARPGANDRGRPSPFAGRTAVRADGLVNLTSGLTYYNAWAQAAGAVAASAQDLGKLMEAVAAGRITVIANQEHVLADARGKPDYLLDWNGGSWGIQGTILYQPRGEIIVIVLGNASNAGPSSHDTAVRLLALARSAP